MQFTSRSAVALLRFPATCHSLGHIGRRLFGLSAPHSRSQAANLTRLKGGPVAVSQELLHSSQPPALAPLPTTHLLRNLVLGAVFTRPWILRMAVSLLDKIANDRRSVLHPDRNVVVEALLRQCIYNHFCAGTTSEEVSQSIANVKSMGYSGIILCPSREIMVGDGARTHASFALQDGKHGKSKDIENWKDLYLQTLSMVGEGDYVGVKYTGAGSTVTEDLRQGRHPQPEFLAALDDLCIQAARQRSLLWIDAEQQALQPTINQWTLGLMRRHNTNGVALVSNTYQAYLKSAPSDIDQHLRIAQREGWTLGIKLVRGAYITSDIRTRIHDTKTETDECYNELAKGLISRSLPGFDPATTAPDVRIFLAGHNSESISKSTEVFQAMVMDGKRYSPVRWGQLQGMADEVSCDLLQKSQVARDAGREDLCPVVYKCLQWGTVGECLQFLLRRAVENSGAAERMAGSLKAMRYELVRRLVQIGRQQ